MINNTRMLTNGICNKKLKKKINSILPNKKAVECFNDIFMVWKPLQLNFSRYRYSINLKNDLEITAKFKYFLAQLLKFFSKYLSGNH